MSSACPINPENFEHVVYVGRKPVMNYVMSVRHHFEIEGAREVLIVARGRSISRAVDVAEAITNRILKDRVVKDRIETCTETIKIVDESGQERERRVSSIYIVLKRKERSSFFFRTFKSIVPFLPCGLHD